MNTIPRAMQIREKPNAPESPDSRPGLCDCKCTEPAGCESLSAAGLAAVTDRNCVPVRGGGEHQEVND